MGYENLTEREISVVRLKTKGLSDKETAQQLSISYWTVRSYIARVKRKLECKTLLEALLKTKTMTIPAREL